MSNFSPEERNPTVKEPHGYENLPTLDIKGGSRQMSSEAQSLTHTPRMDPGK
jgi:hypothetical protein